MKLGNVVVGIFIIAGFLTGMNLYFSAVGSNYNVTVPSFAYNNTEEAAALTQSIYEQVNQTGSFTLSDLLGWVWMGGPLAIKSFLSVFPMLTNLMAYLQDWFGLPDWFFTMIVNVVLFLVVVAVIKTLFGKGGGEI